MAGVTGWQGWRLCRRLGAAAGAPAALVGGVAPVSGGVVSPQARLVSAVEPAPGVVSVPASDRVRGVWGCWDGWQGVGWAAGEFDGVGR
ncbi:hypothetical protein [Mycobacterium tuberculosis]|uniref:hypothetical protein n=1 Tax=Mycobacterium tuberculosis TaxID=1773 RepID=UPI003D7C777B